MPLEESETSDVEAGKHDDFPLQPSSSKGSWMSASSADGDGNLSLEDNFSLLNSHPTGAQPNSVNPNRPGWAARQPERVDPQSITGPSINYWSVVDDPMFSVQSYADMAAMLTSACLTSKYDTELEMNDTIRFESLPLYSEFQFHAIRR